MLLPGSVPRLVPERVVSGHDSSTNSYLQLFCNQYQDR